MKSYMAGIGKDTTKGKALHRLAEGAMVHIATAANVTAGYIETEKLDGTPSVVKAEVFSAVGTARAWDGAVTVQASGKVRVDNTGTTDFVAGDRVLVQAFFV